MSGYIGNIPTPQATQTRDVFTATASQTSFATSGYTPGFLDVFLNGVKLVNGTDFTASNGSDVVLSSGAAANDIVEVVAYTTFEVVDQSFSGNFSVDSPTFVVDAANNRVGVGTAGPNYILDVQDTGDTTLRIKANSSGAGNDDDAILQLDAAEQGEADIIMLVDGAEKARIDWVNSTGELNIRTASGTNGSIDFQPNNSLAMRIDTNGTVLVGKTTVNNTTAGHRLDASGFMSHVRDSDTVAVYNRLTSDGDIVEFRKDGTTVGTIGVQSNDNFVVSAATGGGSGLIFWGAGGTTPTISPMKTGSVVDGEVNLGRSVERFNDLYLSGGVYLGGTGAANLLDDYEEGTWTPVIADATSGGNLGSATITNALYTKIGNTVTVGAQLTNIVTTGMTSTGVLYVRGLPFLSSSTNFTLGVVKSDTLTFQGSRTHIYCQNGASDTWVNFQVSASAIAETNVDCGDVVSGTTDISFSITYFT